MQNASNVFGTHDDAEILSARQNILVIRSKKCKKRDFLHFKALNVRASVRMRACAQARMHAGTDTRGRAHTHAYAHPQAARRCLAVVLLSMPLVIPWA